MLKTVAVAALFAVPALVLSACSAPEQPSYHAGHHAVDLDRFAVTVGAAR